MKNMVVKNARVFQHFPAAHSHRSFGFSFHRSSMFPFIIIIYHRLLLLFFFSRCLLCSFMAVHAKNVICISLVHGVGCECSGKTSSSEITIIISI